MAKKKNPMSPGTAANLALVKAMLSLRSSNATVPIPSKTKYRRLRKQDMDY